MRLWQASPAEEGLYGVAIWVITCHFLDSCSTSEDFVIADQTGRLRFSWRGRIPNLPVCDDCFKPQSVTC